MNRTRFNLNPNRLRSETRWVDRYSISKECINFIKRLLEKEIQELEDTKTIQSDPNLTIAEKRNKLKEMGYGKGNYDVKNIDERIKRFKSELK